MTLKQKLLALIDANGPISVADYMAACLYDPAQGYYATRPLLGGEHADFLTAPEASQMFGELIGLWCVHEWDALGRPDPFFLIELGPGAGALMSDAWRAARVAPKFREAAKLQLVEISTPLKARQAGALSKVGARALWRDTLEDVAPGPCLIIANEFLDCLPIRQFVRESGAWREKRVGRGENGLRFGLAPHALPSADPRIPPALFDAQDGAIAEHAAGLSSWVDAVTRRLAAAPGRALVIDYAGDGSGDTLQALRRHQKVDVLEAPGECDLTARVDMAALKILARSAGLDFAGPVAQGDFLRALGLDARAQALADTHPDRGERIGREHARLTGADQMGALFKASCLSSPRLPPPAGF